MYNKLYLYLYLLNNNVIDTEINTYGKIFKTRLKTMYLD